MPDTLITPPIRSPLMEKPGEGHEPWARTASRDWWLYWDRLGDRANLNARLVTQGTHADRPDAAGLPDGAIYIESDRGAIYQNQNGVWQYLAGTMWGTLSPDQRPTDLGVNDAGFEFRSVDSNPLFTAREFLWSQSTWIEITPVLYGTHAARPSGVNAPARCLYVETDRGNVIYQNQNGTWHYLAGTMFGTLSPDQRPTDLGVNDVGFDFRTSVPPPRQFIWSQSAWVEVTPSPQTPWASDIDGANHKLYNVSAVGIGTPNPLSPLELASTGQPEMMWYQSTGVAGGKRGRIIYDGGAGVPGGGWVFQGLNDSGGFQTNAFAVFKSGKISVGGVLNTVSPVNFGSLPTSAAGLVSGDVWRDAAAGNALKIVP